MQHSDDDEKDSIDVNSTIDVYHPINKDNNNSQFNEDNDINENSPNTEDYIEILNNDIIYENIDDEENLNNEIKTNDITIINIDESNVTTIDDYYDDDNINLVNNDNDVSYNENDISCERDYAQDIVNNDENNEILIDDISLLEVEEEPPKPRRQYKKRKPNVIINNKSPSIKPNCFVGLPKYTLTAYNTNNKQIINKSNSTTETVPIKPEEIVLASEAVISTTGILKKSSSKCIKQIDVSAVRLLDGHLNFDYDVPEKDSSTSMYLCKYCPKAFSSPYHLIFHTRKSHVCQYCLQGFTKAQDLHKHVKEHNSFECSFCNKIFGTNSNLRAHCKKIHNVLIPAHVAFIPMQEQPETSS